MQHSEILRARGEHPKPHNIAEVNRATFLLRSAQRASLRCAAPGAAAKSAIHLLCDQDYELVHSHTLPLKSQIPDWLLPSARWPTMVVKAA